NDIPGLMMSLPGTKPKRNPMLVTTVRRPALNAQERQVIDGWKAELAEAENAQHALVEQGVLTPNSEVPANLKEPWDWATVWGKAKRQDPQDVVNAWAKATGDAQAADRWQAVQNPLVAAGNASKANPGGMGAAPQGPDAVTAWGNWGNT